MTAAQDGTIRLLICDDHPVVRSGIRGLLESQPDFEVVGEAKDGREAVALARSLAPDVVLMDLKMPGTDGLEATARITSLRRQPRVLVLTTYESGFDVRKALSQGARGYLLKDAPEEEIFASVRAVAMGEQPLSARVETHLGRRVTAGSDNGSRHEGTDLTRREKELLELAALGFSNKAIADRLFISEGTVKTHFNRIYTKLYATDRASAVYEAFRRGFIDPGGKHQSS